MVDVTYIKAVSRCRSRISTALIMWRILISFRSRLLSASISLELLLHYLLYVIWGRYASGGTAIAKGPALKDAIDRMN